MIIQKRIIKNPTSQNIEINYRGKTYRIQAKKAIALEDNGQDEQAADFLLQHYEFLIDKTPKIIYPIGEVKKAQAKQS